MYCRSSPLILWVVHLNKHKYFPAFHDITKIFTQTVSECPLSSFLRYLVQ